MTVCISDGQTPVNLMQNERGSYVRSLRAEGEKSLHFFQFHNVGIDAVMWMYLIIFLSVDVPYHISP